MNQLRQRRSTGPSPSDPDGINAFDQTTGRTVLFDTDPETPDHRCSGLKNNALSGITFPRLLRLFWSRRRSIDWRRYAFRLTCLTLMSTFNSFLSAIEGIYFWIFVDHDAIQDFEDPVFVLGHPRTGTTLLHSLLALDSDRFSICNTFCAGFPHCFLWFENIGKTMFASVMSPTRPMDNMRLHFDLPQEDELATCLLTGGFYSPYMSLYFPRDEQEYRPYQTFRDADKEEVDVWTKAFRHVCTKLSIRSEWRTGQRHRLLLKSPCHTGRVRHLLKLHPKSLFVHVHRHPFDIFLSSVHMANTTYGYMFLQRPRPGDLKEYILRQVEILMEEYISCVDEGLLVEGKNWTEVPFEELAQHPFETVQSIYEKLGLEMSDSYRRELQEYCRKTLSGYERNQYELSLLNSDVVREVKSRWKLQFDRWGYTS
jgi:omega-hydroxy-beta-dihydromenaquinone-9 sulfotransferase